MDVHDHDNNNPGSCVSSAPTSPPLHPGIEPRITWMDKRGSFNPITALFRRRSSSGDDRKAALSVICKAERKGYVYTR